MLRLVALALACTENINSHILIQNFSLLSAHSQPNILFCVYPQLRSSTTTTLATTLQKLLKRQKQSIQNGRAFLRRNNFVIM